MWKGGSARVLNKDDIFQWLMAISNKQDFAYSKTSDERKATFLGRGNGMFQDSCAHLPGGTSIRLDRTTFGSHHQKCKRMFAVKTSVYLSHTKRLSQGTLVW